MVLVAFTLASMACLCYFWQQHSDMPLLQFALSVMVFSYSGLLGVYFTALFTQRGTQGSVMFALISGFITTLLFQPYVMSWILPAEYIFDLGFSWQLCIGTAIAFVVCISTSALEKTRFGPLYAKGVEA
jgi:Na+/proline symporter